MKGLPPLSASLLARQTPAVRAQLARARKRSPAPVTVSVTREGGALVIVLTGMVMPSLANMNWLPAHRAKERQSKVLRPLLATLPRPPLPWHVTITRIAPRALDQGGNAYTSAKRIQDDLARWAGVDDRHSDVVGYEVRQETGPVACRIVVASVNPEAPAVVDSGEVQR